MKWVWAVGEKVLEECKGGVMKVEGRVSEGGGKV